MYLFLKLVFFSLWDAVMVSTLPQLVSGFRCSQCPSLGGGSADLNMYKKGIFSAEYGLGCSVWKSLVRWVVFQGNRRALRTGVARSNGRMKPVVHSCCLWDQNMTIEWIDYIRNETAHDHWMFTIPLGFVNKKKKGLQMNSINFLEDFRLTFKFEWKICQWY